MKPSARTSRVRRGTGGAIALAAIAGAGLVAGCRGDRSDKSPRQFFPDMDDSPKWKPQTPSPMYADGRAMRQPPAGVVAFGRVDFVSDAPWAADFTTQRADLLREDDALYRGVVGRSADGLRNIYATRIPIPVNRALLERGQERFNIYCAVCHGYTGEGAQPDSAQTPGGSGAFVGRRWGAPVPTYHDPKYSDPNEPDGKGTDGFLFYTAMHGVVDPATGAQRMPSYAHALSERDAWAVVAYIRALQASQRGTLADVPADRRAALEASKPPPPPSPAPAAPSTPPSTPSGGQP